MSQLNNWKVYDMSEPKQEVMEAPQQAMAPAEGSGSVIQMISRMASDPSADIDKFERLMGMYERMESKQAEAAYNAALAAVQDELPAIAERGQIKNNRGQVQSTYALWEDINKAIKPTLKRHGLALSFRTDTSNGVSVTGVLTHEKGHREQTSIHLPADASGSKNAVQAVASSVSYGKRYTAGALLNLTSHGEDDDAQAAVQPDTISEEQASRIADLIDATGSDEGALLSWVFGGRAPDGATVQDIPVTMHDRVLAALRKKHGGAK